MKNLFKKLLFLLLCILFGTTTNYQAMSQDELEIGGHVSSTTYSYGFYGYYPYQLGKSFYMPQEMGNRAMAIKSLKFWLRTLYDASYSASYGNSYIDGLRIWVRNTSSIPATGYPAAGTSGVFDAPNGDGWVLVYDQNYTFAPLNNASVAANPDLWVEFEFNQVPFFMYDGTSNFEVCVGTTNTSGTYGPNGPVAYMSAFSTPSIYRYNYCYQYSGYAGYTSSSQYAWNLKIVYMLGPEMKEIRPSAGYSLKLDSLYNQSNPSITLNANEIPSFTLSRIEQLPVDFPTMRTTYEITGPSPSTEVWYKMQDPATGNNYIDFNISDADVDGNIVYDINKATGAFAWTSGIGADNKSLDIRGASKRTGKYNATVKVELQSSSPIYKGRTYILTEQFWVRTDNDIAVDEILSPRSYDVVTYPIGGTQGINLSASVRNYGLVPIGSFTMYGIIYKVDYNPTTGEISNKVPIYDFPRDSKGILSPYRYTFPKDSLLQTNQAVTLDGQHLGTFIPPNEGYYAIEYYAAMGDTNVIDQDLTNNVYPVAGSNYIFRANYNIEPILVSIVVPEQGGTFTLGRTIVPSVAVKNTGVMDVEKEDDVKINVKILQEYPAGSGLYPASHQVFINDFDVITIESNAAPEVIRSYDAKTGDLSGWLINADGKFRIVATMTWPPLYSGDPGRMEKISHFTVSNGLSGIIKIGQSQKYKTITQAVNDLFKYGVSGPVTFELMDRVYNEGDISKQLPAVDLRSRIMGVVDTVITYNGSTGKYDTVIKIRPITFVPSYELSKSKGAITINLKSGMGVGFMVGPCDTPSVASAIVLSAPQNQKKKWVNSDGYINFDGGEQKSIRFAVNTTNDFRAPFYFNSVGHISVKNCIIEDGVDQTRSYQYLLPGSTYNGAVLLWSDDYASGTGGVNKTYSAGIVLRTTPPYQKAYEGNFYHVDTILCNNITIDNNEISKFTYGIASIGIGTLLSNNPFVIDIIDTLYQVTLTNMEKDARLQKTNTRTYSDIDSVYKVVTFMVKNSQNGRGYTYEKYYEATSIKPPATTNYYIVVLDSADGGYKRMYNNSNIFSNNTIVDIGRAGIFAGNEEASKIIGNRIHGVTGTVKDPNGSIVNIDCAGIMLGGRQRGNEYNGFNTVEMIIANNEISNINSKKAAYGINHEQTLFWEQINNTRFPDKPERTQIYNNIVWGVAAGTDNSNRYGINISPSRPYPEDSYPYYHMEDITYNMRGVHIANNTIVMDTDTYNNSKGDYIGLKLQYNRDAIMVNNAVTLLDSTFDAARANLNDVILYQGVEPAVVNNQIDYNIYDWNDNSPIDAYRYINTDISGVVLDTSYAGEFNRLEQWQNWMKADYFSAKRDFYKDLRYSDDNIPKLRMVANPMNSPLDNRGILITDITTDIDGKPRGIGDQRYDIGAEELTSQKFMSDAEMLNFAAPATYQASAGPFIDAEYHMVDDKPVTASIIVRNNGGTVLTNRNLRLRVYMEPENVNNENAAIHNYNFETKYYNNEIAHNKDRSNFEDFAATGTPVLDVTKTITIATGTELIIDIPTNWIPETYRQINKVANYQVPIHLSRMISNVTPRYKFVVTLDSTVDEDISNNRIEKYVRYFVKKSTNDILISAYNTYNTINVLDGTQYIPYTKVTNPDFAAGRLNLDTLLAGLSRIGLKPYSADEQETYGVDIVDRKAWDYRNMDYTFYRTLFISDELKVDTNRWRENNYDVVYRTLQDKYFTRNLDAFLNTNKVTGRGKINLILGSENYVSDVYAHIPFLALHNDAKLNIVRNYMHTDIQIDSIVKSDAPKSYFSKTALYEVKKIHNPAAPPIAKDSIWANIPDSYNQKYVKGKILGKDEMIKIQRTGWNWKQAADSLIDDEPFGVIYKQMPHIDGATGIGNLYDTIQSPVAMVNVPEANKIHSLATSSVNYNTIALGFDWRHYQDVERILRDIDDFIDRNGGDMVVPVTLYGFNATPVGKRVELMWHTASEDNTRRFDVERADIVKDNAGEFSTIEQVAAKGNSTTDLTYNATDAKVKSNSKYLYRLKIVDNDGAIAYSDEKAVAIEGIGFEISEITPNPARDEAAIDLAIGAAADATIHVYDMSGKTVMTLHDGDIASGLHTIKINTLDLPSGSYNLVIHIDGATTIKPFNVVK